RMAMRLARDPRPDAGSIVHLRLFLAAEQIPLSETLPILENMGFLVHSERPYLISVPGAEPVWLQDVEMQRRDVGPVSPEALGERFTDAFAAVWSGRA